MEPLNDYVIVTRPASEEKTPAGIVLPETSKRQFTEVWVKSVGPGRPLANGGHEPLGVHELDKVLVPTAALVDYGDYEKEFAICRGSDIVAVVYRGPYKKEGDATA